MSDYVVISFFCFFQILPFLEYELHRQMLNKLKVGFFLLACILLFLNETRNNEFFYRGIIQVFIGPGTFVESNDTIYGSLFLVFFL